MITRDNNIFIAFQEMKRKIMTPQQRQELIEALDNNDSVRAVTIALQICAHLARNGEQDKANKIRGLIDRHKHAEAAKDEFRRQRLSIAASICSPQTSIPMALDIAQKLIMANDNMPVPDNIGS